MHRLSPTTHEVTQVLGGSIKAARLQRRMSVGSLAERVGVSAPTITKIERGDPSVAVGTVFEAAWLLGVQLYGDNLDLAGHVTRSELRLLPQRARPRPVTHSNDF